MAKNKKRSPYDTYADKGLNGPIWFVGALWVLGGLLYSFPAGWGTGVVCAGAGGVALILMYNVRTQAIRYGGVVAMVILTVAVALPALQNMSQSVEQPRPAVHGPSDAENDARQQLERQEFAIRSVTLRQPDLTTGDAELKGQLPNSLNYPVVELKKVDGIWHVGCKTIEGGVLWLKDVYRLFQDFNTLGRCPAGLSASNYTSG